MSARYTVFNLLKTTTPVYESYNPKTLQGQNRHRAAFILIFQRE